MASRELVAVVVEELDQLLYELVVTPFSG